LINPPEAGGREKAVSNYSLVTASTTSDKSFQMGARNEKIISTACAKDTMFKGKRA
jgi:hypothetical protein